MQSEFIPFYYKSLERLNVNTVLFLGYLAALNDRLKKNKELHKSGYFYSSSAQINEKIGLSERQLKPCISALVEFGLISYCVPYVGAKRSFKFEKLQNINLKEKKFLKVELYLLHQIGANAAILFAFLEYKAKVNKNEPIQLTTEEIEKTTGLGRFQQPKAIEAVQKAGLIVCEITANARIFTIKQTNNK